MRPLLALLAASAAAAAAPAPAKPPQERAGLAVDAAAKNDLRSTIADVVRESRDDSRLLGDPYDAWRHALAAELGKAHPDVAAAALAPRFGLGPAAMRRLVALWLAARHTLVSDGAHPGARAAVEKAWLTLLADTGRSSLVLEAAAAELNRDRPCDSSLFDRLLAGAADRQADGWRIVRAAPDCPAYLARFSAAAPGHDMAVLMVLAQHDWLKPADRLPLLAFLHSPAAILRLDAASREAVRLYFTHAYLAALLDADFGARAIAVYEAESPADRARLLAGGHAPIAGRADGLPFGIDDYEVHREAEDTNVREGLAAAYAVAGRTQEAEALLARIPDAAATIAMARCIFTSTRLPAQQCKGPTSDHPTILLLDHLLHRPSEDPYFIAESGYAGGFGGGAGVSAELACRVFAEPAVATICREARQSRFDAIAGTFDSSEDEAAARQVLDGSAAPDFAAARKEFAPLVAAALERDRAVSAEKPRRRSEQAAVDPEPPPFEVKPMPAAMIGTSPVPGSLKGFAPLPDGFAPVRVARSGRRIAVVSLSQNLDPSGEVSGGGYWIHLSDDAGAHWQTPLYTGLAEAFPFVVQPNPRLPLFEGDTLALAVDRRLLDTRTITYPPVGLRTRSVEKNLVVRIPLAALRRDGDGDGIPDIVAHHLLLDGAGGHPAAFVVGRRPAACPSESDGGGTAIEAVLKQVFGVRTGALIEPIDADRSKLLFGGWRSAAGGAQRPIFIEGDPADYACLRPDRLMIVYTAADLERLRRMTPDFHAASLAKIVFNRARDRGYLTWSTGWTGGTYRLRRAPGGWTIDVLSSWIT